MLVVLMFLAWVTTAQAAGLNDTGITFCADATTNRAECVTVNADTGAYPRQDARYGRDAAAAAGILTKIGSGEAGFDFTALDSLGQSTTPSSGATPHPCVRDNVTGLVWEVKTADGGLRDQNWTYTWYDSAHNYDGNHGTASGTTNCKAIGRCDTEKYVADVNATALCGYTDWRMPTRNELLSIVHFGHLPPAIEPLYFPNTPIDKANWSGSPHSASSYSWYVNFGGGIADGDVRSGASYVRLVRGEHTEASMDNKCFAPTIPPSNPDEAYVDHGDGTVTDKRNGLMWKRCAEGQTWNGSTCIGTVVGYSWSAALTLGVNDHTGGYTDWRLPNIKELANLVEICQFNPAINRTIFPNTPSTGDLSYPPSYFWSSTPDPEPHRANLVWLQNFSEGYIPDQYWREHNLSNFDGLNSNFSVRLVRRGELDSGFDAFTRILSFLRGWNLFGNSVNAPMTVTDSFSDTTKVSAVWKWVNSGTTAGVTYPTWAIYMPAYSDGGQATAVGKGYEYLTTINAGEGFWVNAKTTFTMPLPAGTAVASSSFQGMTSGWHLISTGMTETPSNFNTHLSATQPAAGVVPLNITTLWAWDNSQLKWYFYAPSLEAIGGSTLDGYITSQGYLNFTTANKTLGAGVGFWVRK